MLGRVIVTRSGEGEAATHRADVDDLAPMLVTHLYEHELGEAHEPEDVRLELAPYGVERNGLDRAALAVARVVDQYSDGPLRLLDCIHGRAHRLLVGNVERQRSAAGLFEIGDRLRPTR